MLNQHLTEEIIANFAEELLPQDKAAKVQNHLQSCAKCTAEVNNFAKIVSLMKTDVAKDAPADLLVWTKNIFRSKFPEPKNSLLQKLLAVLTADLSANQPVFGERSSASSARQLLYQADDIGISLRISSDSEAVSLMGQIMGDGFENCQISLSNSQNKFAATANELSEFRISAIEKGEYELSIRNSEKEILIVGVHLI